MGAVRYIRKEGDKWTESFVPKLDEWVMNSVCGVIKMSHREEINQKQGEMSHRLPMGCFFNFLLSPFLHRHPFQSIFPFIVNVVIEECKTWIIEEVLATITSLLSRPSSIAGGCLALRINVVTLRNLLHIMIWRAILLNCNAKESGTSFHYSDVVCAHSHPWNIFSKSIWWTWLSTRGTKRVKGNVLMIGICAWHWRIRRWRMNEMSCGIKTVLDNFVGIDVGGRGKLSIHPKLDVNEEEVAEISISAIDDGKDKAVRWVQDCGRSLSEFYTTGRISAHCIQ